MSHDLRKGLPRKNRPLWVLLGTALLTMGAEDSCGPDLLADPMFDLWCEDGLCRWETIVGEVEPVPTWHVAEEGASLVGDPVIISQLIPTGSDEIDCILFSLTADLETVDQQEASISLVLDFNDDGRVEYDHPAVSDDYEEASWFITPPEDFEVVRLSLRKTGGGSAIIAGIRAQEDYRDACLEAPLELAE